VPELLLLNGSPSAGKTTLTKAVQERAPMPLFHRSLDDFFDGYPPERRSGLFERVVTGYLGALRAMVLAGNNVVAEAVMIPERVGLYFDTFAGLDVLLVGVRCPLGICQQREAVRDRLGGPLDLDVEWFRTVHEVPYDLEVDMSSEDSLEAAAEQVIELLQAPPRVRAFAGLH
jgi:chloramphenicol 3-O phosphotransferase